MTQPAAGAASRFPPDTRAEWVTRAIGGPKGARASAIRANQARESPTRLVEGAPARPTPPPCAHTRCTIRGGGAAPGRPGHGDAVLTCRRCSAGGGCWRCPSRRKRPHGRNERESLRLRRCASPAGPSRVSPLSLALSRSIRCVARRADLCGGRRRMHSRSHQRPKSRRRHPNCGRNSLARFDTVIWGDGCSISACACAPPAETIDAACECDAAKWLLSLALRAAARARLCFSLTHTCCALPGQAESAAVISVVKLMFCCLYARRPINFHWENYVQGLAWNNFYLHYYVQKNVSCMHNACVYLLNFISLIAMLKDERSVTNIIIRRIIFVLAKIFVDKSGNLKKKICNA